MDRELILAKKLARKYRTSDPFRICEEMGYTVLFVPLVGIRGFYQHTLRNHLIYIDEDLPEHVQRFVCAHELGHSILHKGSNAIYLDSKTFQVVGKLERAADRFAAGLLFPDDGELMEYADYTLDQIGTVTGLPADLIRWRYEQMAPLNGKEHRL